MKKYSVIIGVMLVVLAGLLYAVSRTERIDAPLPVLEKKSIATVSYQCAEGKSLVSAYYEGSSTPPSTPGGPPLPGGSVRLQLSDGRVMTLPQTISADGMRYANADESFVFWGKGNGVLVLENNAEKSFIGCVKVADVPTGSELSQVYTEKRGEYSLRFPSGYLIDESHAYQMEPGKNIFGVKFAVPSSAILGTNLSKDSYISVETLSQITECEADLFLFGAKESKELTDNTMAYSVASTSDAGAGNRYEETIYAIPGTNPCVAIRYFIHYTVLENYPSGTIKAFDKASLLRGFDAIRRTLIVNP